MDKKRKGINLDSLIERYRSEEKCRTYLEELRWPDQVTCPHCGSKSISQIHQRSQYHCNSCRYQFSVTSGTALHNSHLPLWKWFATAYLMIESENGISANQVKRTVGISYKTAWYLCHRIRAAVSEARFEKLSKIVEVDKTYVGGKAKGFGHGYKGSKTIVVSKAQLRGKPVLQVVDGAYRKTLHQFIRENTMPVTRAIYTDEWSAYLGISDKDTRHETVNHRAEEGVHGNVKLDTVKVIWSLLEHAIVSCYQKLSAKHLDAYLNELEWQYNNRENPYLFRDTMLKLIRADNLPYQALVH